MWKETKNTFFYKIYALNYMIMKVYELKISPITYKLLLSVRWFSQEMWEIYKIL